MNHILYTNQRIDEKTVSFCKDLNKEEKISFSLAFILLLMIVESFISDFCYTFLFFILDPDWTGENLSE